MSLLPFSRRDPLLPEILSLHGRWRRSKEAVVCGEERLSWGAFDQRLNQVAHAARAAGLTEGDRAAVLMSNGLPMLEILFGLMKAGVTSVPLNLSVEEDALANMMADAGAKALFCTSDQAARTDQHDCLSAAAEKCVKVVADGPRAGWTDYAAWRAAASTAPHETQPQPDTPLNIIYSSGTTGLPKGIVHTQRGRKDWASDLSIALRYHGGARTLVTIGLYSNISWVSMLCTAMAGGTLVIEPGFDSARFWQVVDAERITHTSMVPLQFSKVLEAEPEAADGSSLSAMMSAGSPLFPDLKRDLLDRFGPAIIELYGLTEGVITTLEPEEAAGRLSSVGQPLLGTDIKILSEDDAELTMDAPGEIVASGRIVMPEYWNRPEATRDAEWRAPDGSVWLRTGDIGHVDRDGFLYIVDRKKDMILSGGKTSILRTLKRNWSPILLFQKPP
jgi:acyl-CoA synthetase (AMP-forming)/AMP-acid ligase II